jgi:excisionase family DNA binding protein
VSGFEESLGALLEAKLAPVQTEVRRLLSEIEAIRRALPPALATVSEAAKALRLSESTVRRRIRDGSLPVQRVGRALRVDLTALNTATDAEVARRVVALR